MRRSDVKNKRLPLNSLGCHLYVRSWFYLVRTELRFSVFQLLVSHTTVGIQTSFKEDLHKTLGVIPRMLYWSLPDCFLRLADVVLPKPGQQIEQDRGQSPVTTPRPGSGHKGKKIFEFQETCFFRELNHLESFDEKKIFGRKIFGQKKFKCRARVRS